MVRSFAMADVPVRLIIYPERKGGRLSRSIIGIGCIATALLCFASPPALAYRPFDGTDAAVADVNETEIELQPFGYQRMGSQSAAVAPFVVYNYGFAERSRQSRRLDLPALAADGAQR
jgi:hypothetical protein